MTSSRPYLIRALYEWIADNGMTPHILVNAEKEGVEVPTEHVHEGRIMLNVSPTAVQNLVLGNDEIEFNARFSGKPRFIRVPITAALAIYSRENGQGMAFQEEEGSDEPPPPEPGKDAKIPTKASDKKRPSLKVVK